MVIKDCKELCDFYASLFNIVTDFSFMVKKDGSTEFNNKKQIHPYLGNYKRFSNEFEKRMNTFFNEYTTHADLDESKLESKAYVIPMIQNGCVDLNQDKEFTKRFFNLASQFSRVYLATGYFNLTKSYMNTILENKADYKVLTAAPIANGFYQSKGFSKYIPDIYLYLEKNFYDLIVNKNQEKRIEINEYNRKDWSWFFF